MFTAYQGWGFIDWRQTILSQFCSPFLKISHTVCPKSNYPFQIVTYYLKLVKTFWTDSLTKDCWILELLEELNVLMCKKKGNTIMIGLIKSTWHIQSQPGWSYLYISKVGQIKVTLTYPKLARSELPWHIQSWPDQSYLDISKVGLIKLPWHIQSRPDQSYLDISKVGQIKVNLTYPKSAWSRLPWHILSRPGWSYLDISKVDLIKVTLSYPKSAWLKLPWQSESASLKLPWHIQSRPH